MVFADDVRMMIRDSSVHLLDKLYPMLHGVSGPTYHIVSSV